MLEILGRQGDQPRRHLLGGRVGIFGEDNLVERAGLRLDSIDDPRMAVAMRYDPPRRNGVEDAVAAFQALTFELVISVRDVLPPNAATKSARWPITVMAEVIVEFFGPRDFSLPLAWRGGNRAS